MKRIRMKSNLRKMTPPRRHAGYDFSFWWRVYAHHSLIQGSRNGVLYGLVLIVILALIFTSLQGVECTVSIVCQSWVTEIHGYNRIRGMIHSYEIITPVL